MSELNPPSKTRQEQDAWIARVLNVPLEDYGLARNTLDKYGLDAPRLKDAPETRQRGDELGLQKADPQGPQRARLLKAVSTQDNALASEPQAKVPERDTARELGARAAKLLERPPIDADAAGKAVDAYAQAVPLAVSAMRAVRADQANLALDEKQLQPPAEIDDEAKAASEQLTQLRQRIATAATANEPTPADIKAAVELLDEYRKTAKELADAVAARKLRARLLQTVAEQGKTLDTEPQAKVPERDTARDLGAKAAKLLEQPPIDGESAGKAVDAYAQAVPLAVAAMRAVRADQAKLALEEKQLQPPAEIDDEGKTASEQLTQVRQQIEALVTVEEPSPDDIGTAGRLLGEYRIAAQELAEAVAKRLQQRLAAAKETGEKLMAYMKRYDPVQPGVIEPLQQQYGDFASSLAPTALTVQAVKDCEGKLKLVQATGKSLNEMLDKAKKQRAELLKTFNNLAAPTLPGADWAKAVLGKLANARVKAQKALEAPLSPEGVTEAGQQVRGSPTRSPSPSVCPPSGPRWTRP